MTFLWRYAGKPETETQTEGFSDVVRGAYYQEAVDWALEQEITYGTGDGCFSPEAACTRSQIVSFLFRNQGAE